MALITDISTLQFIRKLRNFMHIISMQSNGAAGYTGACPAIFGSGRISKIWIQYLSSRDVGLSARALQIKCQNSFKRLEIAKISTVAKQSSVGML